MNGIDVDGRPSWYVPNKKIIMKINSSEGTRAKSSMHNYLLPSVTSNQKDKLQHHMAMHFYATGASFQRIEECYLESAVAVLRPDPNLLLNRNKLASVLIDRCYTDIKGRFDDRLAKAVVYITTDGCTKIKNDPVVNYMATSPEFSIFLESISTGQQ